MSEETHGFQLMVPAGQIELEEGEVEHIGILHMDEILPFMAINPLEAHYAAKEPLQKLDFYSNEIDVIMVEGMEKRVKLCFLFKLTESKLVELDDNLEVVRCEYTLETIYFTKDGEECSLELVPTNT